MGKPQLGVRIPPSLLKQLDQYAQETGLSKTEVVVNAIANYIGAWDKLTLSERITELETRMNQLELLMRGKQNA